MKKLLLIVCVTFMTSACFNQSDYVQLQKNYSELHTKKQTLEREVKHELNNLSNIRQQVRELERQQNAMIQGKRPLYIVKFKIKQSTFTLNPMEHIKNQVNAIEFELPVEKSFYDNVNIGTDITGAFKYGSLIFNGDFSTLHTKVTGKRVEYR